MADPFLGEIRMVGFNFAPVGWAFCNGTLVPISENDALFALIGTTYGGDGQSTFALPNLQSRVPMHQGTGSGLSPRVLGEAAGVESVTLTTAQIPGHTHVPLCNKNVGGNAAPASNYWAQRSGTELYVDTAPNGQMNAAALQTVGGSQPHD